MDTAELLKRVRKIEIKTKGLSNQIFSGEYNSAFKGRGMSFSEVREYTFGDDIKAIDWNVTARFNTPYVKIFEEERELTVILLVDVSQSAFFGTARQMKHELITEICAVLAFSVINNNDKVGVIFFSDKIEEFIPPKKGKSHVLRIIRELLDFAYGSKSKEELEKKELSAHPKTIWEDIMSFIKGRGKKDRAKEEENQKDPFHQTNIDTALHYFSNVIKRKSIAFLISDFMDTNYETALNLAARKHDLVGIHVYDPRERDLPPVGLARVIDAETGKTIWLDTANEKVRQAYQEKFDQNKEKCKTAFGKAGADLISIPTDKPYVKYLMNFFKKRGH